MNNSQQVLGTESIGKLLLKYSVPAIIGMMVNALYNVVDRMFIGNIPGVGPLAITGLGVTMPIMTIILAFGMLIGVGSATNISIKLGQKRKEEAESIIGNAISYYSKKIRQDHPAVFLRVFICFNSKILRFYFMIFTQLFLLSS